MRKILITGSSGTIGKCVTEGLQHSGRYEIVGTDLRPDPSANTIYLDVSDYESCVSLMKGVDTVIHLAYQLKPDDMTDALKNNYLGTYHIYEAARVCGVKRVIFGSSNHTVGLYTPDDQLTVDSSYKPDNLYAVSKCHGELLGRLYAD